MNAELDPRAAGPPRRCTSAPRASTPIGRPARPAAAGAPARPGPGRGRLRAAGGAGGGRAAGRPLRPAGGRAVPSRPPSRSAGSRPRWPSARGRCGWPTRSATPCPGSTRGPTGWWRPCPVSGGVADVAVGRDAVWTGGDRRGVARVVRIDPRTNQVVATVPVASQPSRLAVTDDAVWVTSLVGGTVTRIDPRTNRVVGHHRDRRPGRSRWPPTTGRCGSPDPLDTLVRRIDPATNTVEATLRVAQPQGVAIGFGAVWVPSQRARRGAAHRPAGPPAEAGRIPVAGEPAFIAVGTDAVWVGNTDGTVQRIDPADRRGDGHLPGRGRPARHGGQRGVAVDRALGRRHGLAGTTPRVATTTTARAGRNPCTSPRQALAGTGIPRHLPRVHLAVRPLRQRVVEASHAELDKVGIRSGRIRRVARHLGHRGHITPTALGATAATDGRPHPAGQAPLAGRGPVQLAHHSNSPPEPPVLGLPMPVPGWAPERGSRGSRATRRAGGAAVAGEASSRAGVCQLSPTSSSTGRQPGWPWPPPWTP